MSYKITKKQKPLVDRLVSKQSIPQVKPRPRFKIPKDVIVTIKATSVKHSEIAHSIAERSLETDVSQSSNNVHQSHQYSQLSNPYAHNSNSQSLNPNAHSFHPLASNQHQFTPSKRTSKIIISNLSPTFTSLDLSVLDP